MSMFLFTRQGKVRGFKFTIVNDFASNDFAQTMQNSGRILY